MFIEQIAISGFLSFRRSAVLALGPGVSVITGPNGGGKSNIVRTLELAQAVLADRDDPAAESLDRYADAGYDGAEEFTIKIDIRLDQQWEKDLVLAHQEDGAGWFTKESVAPFLSGTLIIRHSRRADRPWDADWQGPGPDGADDRGFAFRPALRLILRRNLVLTDNRRLPLTRRFPLSVLGRQLDLRDGAAAGAEVYRLKNGDLTERGRFHEIRETFRALTSRELDVRARPADTADGQEPALVIEPVVSGPRGERLIELSGAGLQEALVLSALLRPEPGQVVVLDEPAVNLEPAVQRRLIGQLGGPGQCIVITHSADLVPFEEPADLRRIVRVAPGADGAGTEIWQPDLDDTLLCEQLRLLQLAEPAAARSLLFARAVVLVEGQTESGALPRWWHRLRGCDQHDQTVNVAFVSVGGQSGFGRYLGFLEAFGISWAVVADGPALRGNSKLANELKRMERWPEKPDPGSEADFAEWRTFWETAGVFTLAREFGDDGGKGDKGGKGGKGGEGGELDAVLRAIDGDLLDQARREAGAGKTRSGAYFAAVHEDPPDAVRELFARLITHLELRGPVTAARH